MDRLAIRVDNYFTTHDNLKREAAVNWSSGEKSAHRFFFVVLNRLIYHSICLTHIEKPFRAFLLDILRSLQVVDYLSQHQSPAATSDTH